MKTKIAFSLLVCLLLSSKFAVAGFQWQFSKCHWVTQGHLDQNGYYYLCDNDLRGGYSAIWASKSSCHSNVVVAPSTDNLYFCNDGQWKYHQSRHPPCVCTGNMHY